MDSGKAVLNYGIPITAFPEGSPLYYGVRWPGFAKTKFRDTDQIR